MAEHVRSVHKGSQDLVLDHYLEVLTRKPGALAGSSALATARASKTFTRTHEAYWKAARYAAAAAKARLTHLAFLAEVLCAECDDREHRRRQRRINEAKFPRHKRLSNFDPTRLPDLPAATLAHLSGGAWIEAGEPLVLLGDSGTGKTHLLIALATAAAEHGHRVRYVTTAEAVARLAQRRVVMCRGTERETEYAGQERAAARRRPWNRRR